MKSHEITGCPGFLGLRQELVQVPRDAIFVRAQARPLYTSKIFDVTTRSAWPIFRHSSPPTDRLRKRTFRAREHVTVIPLGFTSCCGWLCRFSCLQSPEPLFQIQIMISSIPLNPKPYALGKEAFSHCPAGPRMSSPKRSIASHTLAKFRAVFNLDSRDSNDSLWG